MALGRPCIGTAVGGIPEVIEHGVTGWVTGTGPQELAAALGKLVTSAEARRAMGEAGRRRVERSFAVARQAGTVGGLLDAAAKDSWSRPGVTWWQSLRP
jgi:glycosyltransferase involved in cell wall biosynthesis